MQRTLRYALFVSLMSTLHVQPSLAKPSWKRTQCGPGDIPTQWADDVDPENVHPEYPRPQMQRDPATYYNLNGLWEFQPAAPNERPPFGQPLNGTILVPFPVESCLSGVGQTYLYLWYRLVFDIPANYLAQRLLLHFGAIDWQTTVWFNQQNVGNHTGGFDGFTFELTNAQATSNELIVYVYDPSDTGFQPNGKQRISAITDPGGDTYTPSSGIWQTVWLESVPATYITSVKIATDTRRLTLTVLTDPPGAAFTATAWAHGKPNVSFTGHAGAVITQTIENAQVWDPLNPFLYNLTILLDDQQPLGVRASNADEIQSYFGLRSFTLETELHPGRPDSGAQISVDLPGLDLPGYPVTLASPDYNLCWSLCNLTKGCAAWTYGVPGCDEYSQPQCWLKFGIPLPVPNKCRVSGSAAQPEAVVMRPYLNGGFLFLAGWLDQSFWPDGLFTHPTEDALVYDLQTVQTFGLNTVRLHQKVNPERWYWHADRLGIVVLQDAVQKYGNASEATIQPFLADLKAMIEGRSNHPSIVQWTVFNEFDCVQVFPNVSAVVEMVRDLDPSRLIDTNSGGPANDLHLADVNDIHDYPDPLDPLPSATQYAMIGEYGGVGAFVGGHEWVPNQCTTYLQVNTSSDEASTYISMVEKIQSRKTDISVVIYTQIADVERECDGFLNYDRTNKFSPSDTAAIAAANQNLIYG